MDFLERLGLAALLCSTLLAGPLLEARDGTSPQDPATAAENLPFRVQPVSGPSLLTKIRSTVDLNSFGRIGMLGVEPEEVRALFASEEGTSSPGPDSWFEEGFLLSGADIYRLNCRSCHAADARGLQQEIPALLEPVKAASPAYVRQRMEERGRTIPEALAERLATRAELSLRHRLLKGGEVMPPFGHLEGLEVDALLGYLEALAGVPGERASVRVPQSAARVGEHVVKSTCLVCHDSISRKFRRSRVDADLPALDRITKDYSVEELVRKVREGSPEVDSSRGRMPIYRFLSDEEVRAAYLYLLAYPPKPELE